MASGYLKLSLHKGVRKIVINRPQKKNAFNLEMYNAFAKTLNQDARDDSVVLTIITGIGDYYSSGTDLSSSDTDAPSLDPSKRLVQAFIDYPKLVIAVLNGPAIGIAATTLTLCDIVYASDKAYISTPFIRLGLCAEGTSSYMLPRIIGRSRASEALFLSKKITAQEACQYGLVARVIPHEDLDRFIEGLYDYGTLPVNSVKINKSLIMNNLREVLTRVNETEFARLEECIVSEEFGQAVMKFMALKSKM